MRRGAGGLHGWYRIYGYDARRELLLVYLVLLLFLGFRVSLFLAFSFWRTFATLVTAATIPHVSSMVGVSV